MCRDYLTKCFESVSYFGLNPFSPKFGACKKPQKKHEIPISFSYTCDAHKGRKCLKLNWRKELSRDLYEIKVKIRESLAISL